MKAKDLKQLISTISDEEEVYYSAYDQYSEDWETQDDFKIESFFLKGKKIYTIFGQKPYGAESEETFKRREKWRAWIQLFPKENNWLIEEKTDHSAKIIFSIGAFHWATIVFNSSKLGEMWAWIGETATHFNSWSDFFVVIKPIAIKAAQKQREELESLLVD